MHAMKYIVRLSVTSLALLFLLHTTSLQAQQTKSLTLKEAIDLCIKNSGQLKADKAKIQEATAALKEAVERRLPDFKVSGAYLFLPVNPNIDLKTGDDNGGGNDNNPPKVHQAIMALQTLACHYIQAGALAMVLNLPNTWSKLPGWMLRMIAKNWS